MPEILLLIGTVLWGRVNVSDAKRLKVLQEENGKLKRLLADALLDNAALKDVVSRKW
jgi:putative transposase